MNSTSSVTFFILLVLAGDINPNPRPPKCLKVTYANIRSINNNYPVKFITDNDIDLFAMSETLIRSDTTSTNVCEITPPGHNLYQQPWEDRLTGGLGFFFKNGLDPSMVPTKTCTTFKNFLIKISIHKKSFHFLNMYRPPSSSTPIFFEQLQSLLQDIHHIIENLEIIGNFSFHLETKYLNSKTLHSLIDSFDPNHKGISRLIFMDILWTWF